MGRSSDDRIVEYKGKEVLILGGGDTWEFVRTVIKSALTLLPVGGKYYTHCNGVSAKSAVQYFEKMLNSIGVPIEIEHTEANVPSFCEKWVFYQLTRKEGDITEDVNGDLTATEEEKTVEASVAISTDEKEIKEVEKTEPAKEEKKDDTKRAKASPEKKEDKKGGAKDLKDKLEVSKDKGLTKEKRNLDKKAKKAK